MEPQNTVEPFSPARVSRWRDVVWVAAIALIDFATARLSLLLVFEPEGISAIWPCPGVFLSVVLLTRRDLRPYLVAVLCATDFAAQLLAGAPPLVSAAYSLALTADAVLRAWLLFCFVGQSITFGRVRDVRRLACAVGSAV